MQKLELYINNIKADVSEEQLNSLSFTYSLEDYNNPSAVMNSFSTSIELPSTANNDTIFQNSSISYRMVDPRSANSNFNPSKRTPFKLIDSITGCVIESGYVKLESTAQKDHKVSYTITLFGGLGDFLYEISYAEDGSKYDLSWVDFRDKASDGSYIGGFEIGFEVNKETIRDAWAVLKDYYDGKPLAEVGKIRKWNKINFAPVYNGYPSNKNFDPKLLAVSYDEYANRVFGIGSVDNPEYPVNTTGFPAEFTETNDGEISHFVPYTDRNSKKWVLLKSESDTKLSTFEAGDLRSYFMRPIVNVYQLLNKIITTSGRTLNLQINNKEILKELKLYWFTLSPLTKLNPNIKTGDYISTGTLFTGTDTPANYLLSIIKMFGLFMDYDYEEKVVTIRDRWNLYEKSNYMTLKELKVSDGVKLDQLNFDNKYYDLKWKELGSGVEKEYKESYNDDYGSQRIDTGYQFASGSKDFIDNFIFGNAIDSTGQAQYYGRAIFERPEGTPYKSYPVLLGGDDYWSRLVYAKKNPNSPDYLDDTRDVCINGPVLYRGIKDVEGGFDRGKLRINPYWEKDSKLILDPVPKVNMTDSSGKEIEGKNVVIRFGGWVSPKLYSYDYQGNPEEVTSVGSPYVLSDDLPSEFANAYCGGKNCWIDTNGKSSLFTIPVDAIPSFTRYEYDFGEIYSINNRLDFGDPKELYVNSSELTILPNNLYSYWRNYLSDLYNVNTKVMKVKVERGCLGGPGGAGTKPKDAFGELYWFDNSIWALNKMTTGGGDLVDCEFIRVNDIHNYKGEG